MTTPDTTQEPKPTAARGEPLSLDLDPPPPTRSKTTQASATGDDAAPPPSTETQPGALEGDDRVETTVGSHEAAPEPVDSDADRRRIEAQLQALRSREYELRRELAKTDHPDLAETIRSLEAGVYRVGRADAKIAEGLTKAEQRRCDTLSKKIAGLTEKRDALDAQITALQDELSSLGEERMQGYQAERREAMTLLVVELGGQGAALREAGLEAEALIPEIGEWMGEIRALAEELAAAKA